MSEKKSFPNIPISHWHKLRVQFKRSIPGSVTTNYVASVLGMSESSARTNVLPSLRTIGLIDENENTNQEVAKQFRDDNQYQEFCLKVLDQVYPQGVRDAFPDLTSDRNGVKTWFMNHSGVGSSAAQRITAFYFALLEADANVELRSAKAKPSTAAKSNSARTVKPSSERAQETVESESKQSEQVDRSDRQQRPKSNERELPGLNINVQIHISSDATPDQIEQIFASMSKHLYNN